MFILPGRLRIYVKGLTGNNEFADKIAHFLSCKKGIKKVSANQYTGNVLVFFREDFIDVSYIEKLIYGINSKIDCTSLEVDLNSTSLPIKKGFPDIEKKIKSIYNKLIPIVFTFSSISFIASGNPLVPLSALVLVCPYMIYLSTQVTLRSAVAIAYLNGININNPSKLEIASKIDTLVFDNTALLTTDKCKVSNIISSGSYSENRILMLAASCGQNIDDPIFKALVEEASNRNLELKHASNVRVCEKRGISCIIGNKGFNIGNKKQFNGKNLFTVNHLINERKLKHFGQYPVFVEYNHKIIGVIGFLYAIDKNCILAIEAVRETGIENIKIVSEENEELVKYIALKVGIDSYDANLQYESKLEKIAELKCEGKIIALVQNGLHNCEPNQFADIGITMTKTNSEYFDFVIANDDLMAVSQIINISKHARAIISQNCIISIGLDAIGIILVLTNSITPYSALLYKFINSFIVLLNASKPVKYQTNISKRVKIFGRL